MNAFDQIVKELQEYDLQSVADVSGIDYQTIKNLINGIHGARNSSLEKVAKALGYSIVIKLKR